MLEETGYAGDPPRSILTVWSNPSLMTSKITTIAIANARLVRPPEPDHGEEVEVELIDQGRTLDLIGDGRIDHALVVMGLYAWLSGPIKD